MVPMNGVPQRGFSHAGVARSGWNGRQQSFRAIASSDKWLARTVNDLGEIIMSRELQVLSPATSAVGQSQIASRTMPTGLP